ncbi:hypothetical protein Tsubulata_031549 [Turnera subulata]|uniref:Zinc knuckle CX2CX4HX4C domain-containing protein n=1 Tax=Turnera subulata TaxID=218843 RepID=A0A9Q0FL22_9ROSI|nr:hypothetical protein Tsubulata_031549 [Turnera subulata]
MKLDFLKDMYQDDEWEMLSFIRVHVMLDLHAPLRKQLMVSAEEGEAFTVYFKYENLPSFCFLYGRLGHTMKDCGYNSDEEIGVETQARFGDELRDPSFKKAFFVSKLPWLSSGMNTSTRPTAKPLS